jgi:hypothetical protein
MSLRTIEASLFAQLETLLTTASPGGYVAAVARVAGDRESQAKLEAAALVSDNLVAIGRERSSPIRREGVSTLAGASSRTVSLTRWRVKVLVRDLRAQADVLTAENTGFYALIDAVTACLEGFEAAGVLPNTRVQFAGDEPDKHKPGRYIATLFFETRHAIDAADSADEGEEPLLVNADVNLEGQEDTEPNPVAQLSVEP